MVSSTRHTDMDTGPLHLVDDLVPAVRLLLETGLTRAFMRRCVRIGESRPLTGGLKSKYVGGLRIDVNTVVKLGNEELKLHRLLMETVNKQFPRTFPQVLQLSEIAEGQLLLFMEQLSGYQSLLGLTYRRSMSMSRLTYLARRALDLVAAVHKTKVEIGTGGAAFPSSPDPYSDRLERKLNAIINSDPALTIMLDYSGKVNGIPVPPLRNLLQETSRWIKQDLKGIKLRLVHGDPHLGNVLARPRGSGFSCHLIDPNPMVGVSDPLYDYGKVLHWASPVGWAVVNPSKCRGTWRTGSSGWSMSSELIDIPMKAEDRRRHIEKSVWEFLNNSAILMEGDWRARIWISIASAHLGLASILRHGEQLQVRRFVLCQALTSLLRAFT